LGEFLFLSAIHRALEVTWAVGQLTSHIDNDTARSWTVANGTVGPECNFSLPYMQICL